MTGFDILQYFKDTPIAEAEQALGFALDIIRGRKRPGGARGGNGAKGVSRPKRGLPTPAAQTPAGTETPEPQPTAAPPQAPAAPAAQAPAPAASPPAPRRRRQKPAAAEPLVPDPQPAPAPAPLASVGEDDPVDPEAPVGG